MSDQSGRDYAPPGTHIINGEVSFGLPFIRRRAEQIPGFKIDRTGNEDEAQCTVSAEGFPEHTVACTWADALESGTSPRTSGIPRSLRLMALTERRALGKILAWYTADDPFLFIDSAED